MRKVFFAPLIALAAVMLMAAGQPPPSHLREFSDTDSAELDRVSAYLNALTTLKGEFVQLDPNGALDQGQFYIAKPGKMRFEYNSPSPTLIVSDGRTVAVVNKRLNTIDRYALADTPLNLILGDRIDLRHSPSLVSISHDAGSLVVGARTSANRHEANLTIVFTEPDIELRQWTVIDNQGQKTTVALRDVESGVTLDPSLFSLPKKP